MPRGGKRIAGPGKKIGRPKVRPEQDFPEASKSFATEILELKERPKHPADCLCAKCRWWGYLTAPDLRLRFDADKDLTNRAYGRPVQTVNHLHDKPLEHLVTHTISERLRIALEKGEARVRSQH